MFCDRDLSSCAVISTGREEVEQPHEYFKALLSELAVYELNPTIFAVSSLPAREIQRPRSSGPELHTGPLELFLHAQVSMFKVSTTNTQHPVRLSK